MKTTFLLLASAATLAVAACGPQDRAPETATTTPPTEATMPADGTVPTLDADYASRASRVATRMSSDMKITDTTTTSKLQAVYANRIQRLDALRKQYATDTTGLGAARRAVNTDTDQQVQAIFTEPTQYQTYQQSRARYDEEN